MDHRQIILEPKMSEKSYAALNDQQYVFKVHKDADKLQIRRAVEASFGVTVLAVRTVTMPAKPKRRGAIKGIKPGYKKAVVKLKEGDTIQIFEGVH